MSQVATIKSITTPYFGSAAKDPNFRPSVGDLALALERAQNAARKAGKPFAIHHDGRAYVPYQRFTKLRKIGKGNGKRV